MKRKDLIARMLQDSRIVDNKAYCPKGYHLHDTQVVSGETCECFPVTPITNAS